MGTTSAATRISYTGDLSGRIAALYVCDPLVTAARTYFFRCCAERAEVPWLR